MLLLERHDELDLDAYRRVVVGGEAFAIAPELLGAVQAARPPRSPRPAPPPTSPA